MREPATAASNPTYERGDSAPDFVITHSQTLPLSFFTFFYETISRALEQTADLTSPSLPLLEAALV